MCLWSRLIDGSRGRRRGQRGWCFALRRRRRRPHHRQDQCCCCCISIHDNRNRQEQSTPSGKVIDAEQYAAFNVATGEVRGHISRRHRATEFRQFFSQIDRATPPAAALHLIVDNSSAYTAGAIRDFLAARPRFHLRFTPTSASWINAVETWLGQLERRSLRRGVITSVSELREEIRRFIDTHNMHSAKPFRWTKAASAILDAVEQARQSLRQETSRAGHYPMHASRCRLRAQERRDQNAGAQHNLRSAPTCRDRGAPFAPCTRWRSPGHRRCRLLTLPTAPHRAALRLGPQRATTHRHAAPEPETGQAPSLLPPQS